MCILTKLRCSQERRIIKVPIVGPYRYGLLTGDFQMLTNQLWEMLHILYTRALLNKGNIIAQYNSTLGIPNLVIITTIIIIIIISGMLLSHKIQKAENHCPTSLWKAIQVETSPSKGTLALRLFLNVICSQILMKTNVPSHFSQLTEKMVSNRSQPRVHLRGELHDCQPEFVSQGVCVYKNAQVAINSQRSHSSS